MTQAELFAPPETFFVTAAQPRTVTEAIAFGRNHPAAGNPFLWSSTLWEAVQIGKYLHAHDLSAEGFRKSRGSSYANRHGLTLKIIYDRQGGTASWAIIASH